MSSGANPIGNLEIIVSADLSELQANLAEIPGLLAGVSGSLDVSAAAGSFDELDQSIKDVGTEAATTEGGLSNLGQKIDDTGESAHEGGLELDGLYDTLISLAEEAGVAFGAYELLKESFEAFAEIQSAQIALTALTGDAAGAALSIENLREMATAEGLDFPSLVTADQRMVALGFSAAQIPAILQAVADAAAATGASFDQTANAVDRLALSGTAGARQLATLGLSLTDLAAALGTTTAGAAAAFKALDEASRVNVLTDALDKYAGVAVAAGQSLSGQWQDTKTQVTTALESIGEALTPIAEKFLTAFSAVAQGTVAVVSGLKNVLQSMQDILDQPSPQGTTWGNLIALATGSFVGSALGAPGAGAGTPSSSVTDVVQQMLKGQGSQQQTSSIPFPESVQKAATADVDQLTAALTAAQTQLGLISTAYKDGYATSEQYAQAQVDVKNAFLDLHPEFQGVQEFALSAADLMGGLKTAVDDTANAFGDTYVDSLDKALSGQQTIDVTINGVTFSLAAGTQAWSDNYDQLTQNADEAKQVADLYPILSDSIDKAASALDDQIKNTVTLTSESKALWNSIDTLDKQGYQSLLKSIPAATAYGGQFHDEVVAQIPDISELQSKLTDATTAYHNIQQATDADGNSVYNNTQQIQAHITQLNADIALMQASGQNTDHLRQEVDQLTQSLQQQPTWWSAMNNAALQVTKTIETQLGSALTSIIDGTSSVAAAFEKMGESVLNIILNTIIKQGITELLNSLSNVDGIIGTIAKDFGGVASQATAAGTSLASATGLGNSAASIGASGTGAIGDTVGTGDTLAGVGGATSSAGGVAGSSISGLISTVSSVVTAVSSVATAIGTFIEGGAENSNLFDIKVTLAGISNILFQMQQMDIGPMANFFAGYPDYLYNVQHADLVNIDDDIQSVANNVSYFLGQVNNTLNSIYNVALLGVGIQAKTAAQGTLNVTLTNTDPKQVAENIATYLGLTAPSFV